MKHVDLTNQRFGRLHVVQQEGVDQTSKQKLWRCVCDCGGSVLRTGNVLKRGRQSNCGCLTSELKKGNKYGAKHGHTSRALPNRTPEYISWSSMIQRCTDQNHVSYQNYGAIGIEVCESWRNSFERFHSDMGHRPRGHTLDRIDPRGNYTPENCRWATWSEQQNNRTNNRFVTVDGQSMTITNLARLAELPTRTMFNRVNRLGKSEFTLAEVQRAKPIPEDLSLDL